MAKKDLIEEVRFQSRRAIETSLIWVEQKCTTEENRVALLDTLLLIRECADFLYNGKLPPKVSG